MSGTACGLTAGLGRRFPMRGQELLDPRDIHRRKSLEDVGEVFLGVYPTSPATDDQRVDDRAAPAGVRMPNEEPSTATDGGNPDGVFDEIIVDHVGSGLQVAGQCLVFVEQIADGLAEAALRQDLGLERLGAFLELGP